MREGKTGAAAFVRYYIDLLNYAAHSGDVDPLRDYAPACRGCNLFADLYEQPYERGGYFKGYQWTIINLIASPFGEGHDVLVGVKQAAGVYVPERGAAPERHRPRDYEFRFTAKNAGGSWQITEMVSTA
jgi:hypothetical protein